MHLSLARWLGPWADDRSRPQVVRERALVAGDPPVEAWIYRPRGAVRGAYLIAPGLHYAGPADPRMDRFCAVLAASGILVLAPFLPDYTALRVTDRTARDLERALDRLLEDPALPPGLRPGVFSISFGSLLALRLAGELRPDQVGALVLFGGYADWDATIRFCLTGELDAGGAGDRPARDPLNQPVVFMNLIDAVMECAGTTADPAPLLAGWRRYVEATWGREEMKQGGRHREVARRMAIEIPAPLRALFLVGCGAEPGGYELVQAALARDTPAFLDPRPHLRGVRGPVFLVHGIDDDVIPYPQSARLAEALPPHVVRQVHLTGLYGHTRKASAGALVRSAPLLYRELVTMARILDLMVAGATGGEP